MWNNFISSLNDEESTINNVFCSNNIFKISSENQVKKLPRVQVFTCALTQNNNIVIAIDENIFLFDENNSKCSIINFNSIIDCLAISTSENIVICALNDGNLHGISIKKGIPLFNVQIERKNIRTDNFFVGVYPQKNFFYVCCTDGRIYRSSCIDESGFLNSSTNYMDGTFTENDTCLLNNSYIDNITLNHLSQFECLDEIVTSLLILDASKILSSSSTSSSPSVSFEENISDEDLIIISATKNILKLQYNGNHNKIIIPHHYDGIRNLFKLKNYILALSNSGHVFEICPQTFCILPEFGNGEFIIDDLRILEDNDERIELLILTKFDERQSREIKIIDFPSFECTNNFPMTKYIWLVNQSKNSVNLYYLNGTNLNNENLPQEIEMKSILELDPAKRIKKLIYKGRLDEAEEFGKQFKLSLQPIYEEKAKKILKEINFMNNVLIEDLSSKFEQLLEILKLIENKNFIITICNTYIPDRRTMETYLKTLLSHLNNDQKYEKDVLDIQEQLLRLETLDIIDPYETNLDWQKFVQHSNILEICTSYFKKDMPRACVIWKRHIAHIIPYLDKDQIIKLLNMIPANIEPIRIIQWLQHFIPPVSQIHSNSLKSVVIWCIEKTRSLQYSNYWPDVGLEFVKDIKEIFENLNFLHSDVFRQYESCMEKLTELVNTLNELFILKKNYNINLTLDNYVKESLDDTSIQILQRVQLKDLKILINDFLHKIYMEKFGKTPINAVILYIKYLVARKRNTSSWLERAVHCIETLHCEDDKLKCCIMVLKSSPVPWPNTIKPLLKLRNSNHPLAKEIATEFELQNIKMIRLKYGWSVDATENNMKLIFRILKLNLPDTFDDLKNVIRLTPQISSQANFYCCYELCRKGKIDIAIKYFNLLNENDKNECREKFINIFARILDDDDRVQANETDEKELSKKTSIHQQENLNNFEFLKLIIPETQIDNREFLKNLINTQILKDKYRLKLSYLDLNCKSKRELLFEAAITRCNAENNSLLLNSLRNGDKPILKLWEMITELCKILNLDKIYGFMKVCEYLNNLHITCAIVYNILEMNDVENSNNAEIFIDFAVLLICQHIIYLKNNQDKIFEENDVLVYPLTHKLLRLALKYDKLYQSETVEFLKWISIGSSLYPWTIVEENYGNVEFINENIKNSLNDSVRSGDDFQHHEKTIAIESVFDRVTNVNEVEKPKTNPEPILKCISFGLLIIRFYLEPANSVLNRLFKFIPVDYFDLAHEIKENFEKSLEHIFRLKHYSCWYSIAKLFLEYQKQSTRVLIDKDFLTYNLKRMFRHNLAQKEPNFTYLFAILVSESEPETFLLELENELRNEQQKINYLILSEMYNTSTNNINKALMDRESRKKYYYYLELCKLNSNKRNLEIKNLSIQELIKELRNHVLDIKLLEKMSRDFNWDDQELLVTQVITILSSQEPQFEIKIDAFGNEELQMKTNVQDIYQLCVPYIDVITNINLLATELIQFLTKINSYFYELYLCVINILKFIDKLPKTMNIWSTILLFLKDKMIKKRRQRQNQIEIDYWLKLQKNTGVLPKISKYRFPFMPLIEKSLENFLDEEITVDNCESWFPLIQLYNALHENITESQMIELQENFCIKAVKNSSSEYWQIDKQQIQHEEWHKTPIFNSFLQSVLRLIKHIKDHSKIFFILYFIATSTTNGIDKVQASFECYTYATKNESILSKNQKTQEFIVKIKRMYPCLKTQHLLYINNLIEDKLLQLLKNPKELIYALYNHDLILKFNKYPNINKIAKEIAELYNLEFESIQLSLLNKWLAITDQYDISNVDETFCALDHDSSLNSSSSNVINDEYVIRASYILSSWDSKDAIEFLISNIFSAQGSKNTEKQLKNLECFIKLINETTITFAEYINQKQYMILKCVHYLNQFGYNFTIEKFDDYDKIKLLKILWQKCATNQIALEIMIYICLLYNICIPQIWNGLLKQMIQLQMLKQLDALVEIISCNKSLIFIDGLALAWKYVLREPFKNANRLHLSNQQQENLLKRTLHRIQSCPLIGKFNFIEICEDCVRIDRINFAAILIGISPKEQKEEIKKIVKKHISGNLKKEILELEETGILLSTINFVLNELGM